MVRDVYGYTVLIVLGVLVGVFLLYWWIRKYQKEKVQRLIQLSAGQLDTIITIGASTVMQAGSGPGKKDKAKLEEAERLQEVLPLLCQMKIRMEERKVKDAERPVTVEGEGEDPSSLELDVPSYSVSTKASRAATDTQRDGEEGGADLQIDSKLSEGDEGRVVEERAFHESQITNRTWNETESRAVDSVASSVSNVKKSWLYFPSASGDNESICFRPERFFDELDDNKDGFLEYAVLQENLQLDTAQLQVFVRRMNEYQNALFSVAAFKKKDDGSVSRRCFVRYFLIVLQSCRPFAPSERDVEVMWFRLSAGESAVQFSDMFDSALSEFMTDAEIQDLISGLRGYIEDKSDHDPQNVRRRHRRSSVVIGRGRALAVPESVFLAHYAECLQLIAIGECFPPQTGQVGASLVSKSLRRRSTVLQGHPDGVDITFRDLSLTVNVGGQKINVVNSVSGRIPAGTMAALMGGSGAGKDACQLLVNKTSRRRLTAFYFYALSLVSTTFQERLLF